MLPGFLVLLTLTLSSAQTNQKNVLFIIADDMRPDIGVYNDPDSPIQSPIITPNLDRLAAQSLVLNRAYCQYAVCGPSRSSFLTGRRPDTNNVYNLNDYWREVGGNFTTIPQFFKQQGYRSIGLGKVFHKGESSGFDDPISWTEPVYHAPNDGHYTGKQASWYGVSAADREEKPLPDEQIVSQAISWIQNISQESPTERQPFFIGVGLHKPHLPFVFPEEYLDDYPLESLEIAPNPYAPVNMPSEAWYSINEIRSFNDIQALNLTGEINTTMPENVALDLKRAYYASISYVDHLVGTLLDALEASNIADETIITFLGDHGFQLGEHGEWAKKTNFHVANRVPLMLSIPGVTDSGIRSDAFAELIDVYPTLVEATGLPEMQMCPEESSDVEYCREGQSLLPLADTTPTDWKDRAFFQYPRGGGEREKMGYSMMTDNYHYTEWVQFSGPPDYLPDWETVWALELYDHTVDPLETVNVVEDPDYADIVTDLHDKLLAGWRAVAS